MYKKKKYLRDQLIFYLNKYLSKPNLKMKPVIRTIKDMLNKKVSITPKQFGSVIKFIEREPKFINTNRETIITYFSPIIKGWEDYQEEMRNDSSNNLETILS